MSCTSTNKVTEGSSALYTTTLVDEAAAPVPLAVLTTLRLWLRDVETGEYINAREDQNVLNASNVTYHATSGLLTWDVQPEDNVVLGASSPETHEAEFQATWSGGGAKTWTVTIKVTDMHSLT